MIKKYVCLVIILLLGLHANSQSMPIDFSDSSDSFIPFNGAGFAIVSDPMDASNMVGQFFNDDSNAVQGTFIDVTIDLDVQQSISLDFYSFDPNPHTVLLKLENGEGVDVEVFESFSVPSPPDWQTLTFDFSDAVVSENGNSINATGLYSRLVLVIDEESAIPGTFLIDNIDDGSIPSDPNELDVIYTDLVWSDEFDVDGAVDPTKWHHQVIGPNNGQWFNGELQHYTDRLENSFIADGNLNIVAKNENFTQDGVSLDYTSARLNSKFAFAFGRVDVRAKLPAGDGTWPAIWTLGKNISEVGTYWFEQGFGTTSWPACGEIDIMEHGLHAPNEVSSAIHTPSSFGNTMNTATQFLPAVDQNYHVYSMNWSPNQITFMIDGVGYYTYEPSTQDASTWPFDEEQFLLLNVAMGGIAGAVDPNFTQSSMIIDYVRVYQNPLDVEDRFAEQFAIYPNPTSNFLNIQTNQDMDRISLFSITGQLVVDKIQQTDRLDTSSLKEGIYFLKIYSGKNTVTKKVIVK